MRVIEIKTGIDLRDHDLYGPDWLDAARYPLIEIKITRAEDVQKKAANTATMTLVGTCGIHGVTHDTRIAATLIYLDESPKTMQRAKGDLISVRANFEFKLSDYKITGPKSSEAIGLKVGDVQPSPGVDLRLQREAPGAPRHERSFARRAGRRLAAGWWSCHRSGPQAEATRFLRRRSGLPDRRQEHISIMRTSIAIRRFAVGLLAVWVAACAGCESPSKMPVARFPPAPQYPPDHRYTLNELMTLAIFHQSDAGRRPQQRRGCPGTRRPGQEPLAAAGPVRLPRRRLQQRSELQGPRPWPGEHQRPDHQCVQHQQYRLPWPDHHHQRQAGPARSSRSRCWLRSSDCRSRCFRTAWSST